MAGGLENFDWTAWALAELHAAEERTGADRARAIVHDARYARVRDILARRERALQSLQQASVEARRMARELGR